MKTLLHLLTAAALLLAVPLPSHALVELAYVTKEMAQKMGLEIRAHAAGAAAMRVELEFAATGELKGYSRVDLEIHDGATTLVSSTLQEDRSKPGRIVVSFYAVRTQLEKLTLRVVAGNTERMRVAYDIPVKDFVALDKL